MKLSKKEIKYLRDLQVEKENIFPNVLYKKWLKKVLCKNELYVSSEILRNPKLVEKYKGDLKTQLAFVLALVIKYKRKYKKDKKLLEKTILSGMYLPIELLAFLTFKIKRVDENYYKREFPKTNVFDEWYKEYKKYGDKK